MSGERTHSRFSPSRSEQFFLCPGSVNLMARSPARVTSIYAEEGITAHDVLEAGLRNACRTAREAIAGSDHCVADFDDDFHNAIQDALDYIWGIMDEHPRALMYVEVRVNPPVSAAPNEAYGYCDVAIYDPDTKRLWVVDYKHGVGISKAVVGNTQVQQYAAGFLYDENTPLVGQEVEKVTLVIVQPRAFHADGDIREYDTTPLELVDYLMRLDEGIEAAMKPDAPLVPGVEQCRFCDARSVCPAIEAQALAVAGSHFQTIRDIKEPNLPRPSDIDVQRLGYIKQMMPVLLSWFNDVDAHIYELQMNGTPVPGTKLVEAHAKRTWHGEETERAYKLAAMIGCDVTELYRVQFETITAVEKKMVDAYKRPVSKGRKRQAAEDARQIFAYFTTKQSSGNLTLVTEDDPRPAVNRALTNFNQVIDLIPTQKGE